MSVDEFKKSLRADVVIANVGPRGALNIMDVLAAREWFDARRRKLQSLPQAEEKNV